MVARLLIVDGSNLTAWLVAQAAPEGVEVVRAETFAKALRILDDEPPDAAIFNLTPAHLEWRTLVDRCRRHAPPIPFLCTSALDAEAGEIPLLPCPPEDFCPKTRLVHELRGRVAGLLARTGRGDGGEPSTHPVFEA